MKDLIDRQAAIDALAKFVPYAICDESTESYTNGLTDAYNLILQLPSVQPDIIYCKDCKDYHKIPPGEVWVCRYFRRAMMGNDFCSYAERRTE